MNPHPPHRASAGAPAGRHPHPPHSAPVSTTARPGDLRDLLPSRSTGACTRAAAGSSAASPMATRDHQILAPAPRRPAVPRHAVQRNAAILASIDPTVIAHRAARQANATCPRLPAALATALCRACQPSLQHCGNLRARPSLPRQAVPPTALPTGSTWNRSIGVIATTMLAGTCRRFQPAGTRRFGDTPAGLWSRLTTPEPAR